MKRDISNALKNINNDLRKLEEGLKAIGTDRDTKVMRLQTSNLLKDTSIQIRELSHDIKKYGELPIEGGLHKKKQHID
jgi:t-SNARE complex subunit (syntaxin)